MLSFFLRKKVLVNLLTVFIVAIGIMLLTKINRATYPHVEFDILKITTTYPGASAEDVEVNVTKKIEDEIKNVRGLDKYLSNSLENLSIIYVWVDPDADDRGQVKDDLRRAVDRVSTLPEEVKDKPLIDELKSSNVAVIEVAVSGDADEYVLRRIAKDLEEKINEIDGVGFVELLGYRDQEVKVLVDYTALEEQYVSLNHIIQSIQDRNIRESGGSLESFTNEKKIVTFSEFNEPLDVKDVIVRENFGGKQIKLTEVSAIAMGFEDYSVIPRTSGQRSINLLIRSQSDADIIDISEEIKIFIEQTKKTLPKGVNVEVVVDYSRYTASLLNIVEINAIYGFFLVLIVLFIFLNRSVAIWTAAGIPISFLGAIMFFPVFGVNINFVTLITLVLVLGMIVDDAIVVAENINRHREEGKSPYDAAIIGVKEVFWPVTVTIITTIIAFMSLLFMVGVSGKFIRQIPVVVVLTLGVSLIESVLILPSHIANSKFRQSSKGDWFLKIQEKYKNIINWFIGHRLKTISFFILFFMSAIGILFGPMKLDLFPYSDIDVFYVVAELPDGSSLDETSKRMKEIEKLVEKLPQESIVNYTTTIGHNDRDVYGVTSGLSHNRALVTVFLKPAQERDHKSEELMQIIRDQIKGIKGFKRLELDKFNDGPPIGRPITVTFVSSDDELRHKMADELVDYLKSVKGVQNIDADNRLGKDELLLKPNYELMARFGITSRNLASTIRVAYNGVVVSSITRNGEDIDFRVQLKKEQRQNISVLKDLQVMNNQGKLIKIGAFTNLEPAKNVEVIKHYNGRRSTTITGDVDTKLLTSSEVNALIANKFEDKVTKYPGLRIIFGGEEKATQESMESFGMALIWSLIAIYFVLVILFDSFSLPFIIVSIVPFGLAGVIYTFFIWGLPLSFLGIIGTLGLIGVMVNDSLVMVSHLDALKKKNKGMTLELMITGCLARLRPVLLTPIRTVIGLLPTLIGLGGYEPFIIPLVLALAGGLVFATPTTLILVPALYSLCLNRKKK